MIMYPHATLEDLCKAFPAGPLERGEKAIFVDVASEDPADKAQLQGSFIREDELITTGDGKKVALIQMWTKYHFEKIAAHAKQYGILVADFEKAAGGAKRGHFRLEYLNGYVPPVPEAPKKSKVGLWVALAALVVALAGLLAFLFAPKPEPQVVEKVVTIVDTVYVQQLEEIERNFNAAEFVQGKADLSEDAKFVLHDLAKMMQKHPQIKLELVGHTSAEGDAEVNQKLSEARAQAAVDFLVSHGGIDASRLSAIGKGSSELKNTEDPYAPENRRTEFIVVE
jgi:outer membrane protein OmpA-like peptidoglycan-associated protein